MTLRPLRIGAAMDQPLTSTTTTTTTISANTSHRGSTGNVLAALASFFVPGLGQLVQGRLLPALLFFVGAILAWCCCLGWIVQIWATLDAALWRPKIS